MDLRAEARAEAGLEPLQGAVLGPAVLVRAAPEGKGAEALCGGGVQREGDAIAGGAKGKAVVGGAVILVVQGAGAIVDEPLAGQRRSCRIADDLRAALRAKLKDLGFELADNQLNDVFVRFKDLADRKKEVYDDDLIALVRQNNGAEDRLRIKHLRVVCGTEGPQTADLTRDIDGVDHSVHATGDGPVDATFKAVKALFPISASLQLYQVNAVTEGTDAQATVSVRLEEDGRIATGQSADTDTVLASAKAYVNAINRLLVRRGKSAPGEDTKGVSYKDVG